MAVVRFLLQQGADPFRRDELKCQTAMHYAAECGHVECIRLVAQKAAEVEESGDARCVCVCIMSVGGSASCQSGAVHHVSRGQCIMRWHDVTAC